MTPEQTAIALLDLRDYVLALGIVFLLWLGVLTFWIGTHKHKP